MIKNLFWYFEYVKHMWIIRNRNPLAAKIEFDDENLYSLYLLQHFIVVMLKHQSIAIVVRA